MWGKDSSEGGNSLVIKTIEINSFLRLNFWSEALVGEEIIKNNLSSLIERLVGGERW